MTTLIKNKRKSLLKKSGRKTTTTKAAPQPGAAPEIKTGSYQLIPEHLIDFSPINYRRLYPEKELWELSESIGQVGILHPVKARPGTDGRFELVIGEGRLRAARIAGLKEIPATVAGYTDAEVRAIQLQENLQRTNPHPLDDANAILQMQDSGMTIDEIAARLGKSKQFIFVRLRIAGLVAPLKSVFAEHKMTLQDAWDIAALTPESQQEFFEAYCKEWEKPSFRLLNVRGNISRYTYDLKNAPFNTKDKKLLPEAGACTGCPFNSAVLKSLFPEMSKEAICKNKSCYNQKCQKTAEISIAKAATEQQPQAVIYRWGLSDTEKIIIDSLPETGGIPQHCIHDITVLHAPDAPDKEDFEEYTGDEEENGDDNTGFDEERYQEALQEYEEEISLYNDRITSGTYQKGLLIERGNTSLIYFLPHKERPQSSGGTVTAKEVQDAIKAGTATPELLAQEISRIEEREQRKQEIDRDKVQANVHQAFLNDESEGRTTQKLTRADYAALRLLVYQSLDWSVRRKVEQVLFAEDVDTSDHAAFFDFLADMPEEKFAFLIRMAIAGKSESKLPSFITGYVLYQMAEQAGTDVAGIEAAQAEIAKKRGTGTATRIEGLNKKIGLLKA